MAKRKPELTETDLIDWWLGKYHNTSIKQILEENPEWEANPSDHTKEFYDKYRVTQDQHDEWRKWAIDEIAKRKRLSKKYVERKFWLTYLNTAPSVIKEDKAQ